MRHIVVIFFVLSGWVCAADSADQQNRDVHYARVLLKRDPISAVPFICHLKNQGNPEWEPLLGAMVAMAPDEGMELADNIRLGYRLPDLEMHIELSRQYTERLMEEEWQKWAAGKTRQEATGNETRERTEDAGREAPAPAATTSMESDEAKAQARLKIEKDKLTRTRGDLNAYEIEMLAFGNTFWPEIKPMIEKHDEATCTAWVSAVMWNRLNEEAKNHFAQIVALHYMGRRGDKLLYATIRSAYDNSILAEIEATIVKKVPEAERQREFIKAIVGAIPDFKYAENNIQKEMARAKRMIAIESALNSNLAVSDWIGTVSYTSTNSYGKGIVTIRIHPAITLSTRSSESSSVRTKTLIERSSPLFPVIAGLSRRDSVKFSGVFVPSERDYVAETSITMKGSMNEPEFLFKFTSIEKQ